jgi:hypothetical protein
MSKYKNVKVKLDGITFDSKKEAVHYAYLKSLEKRGIITDLQLQTKLDFKIDGKKIFTYKPDFEYNDEFGHHIVDVKGVQTPVFKLKKKLIEAQYKIKIEII